MEHRRPDPFGPIGPLGAIARPGKPGDPIPEVDPEDIKAVCKDYDDIAARHPGEQVAMGLRAIQGSILERSLSDNRISALRGKTPGADATAVSYRASALRCFMGFQEQVADHPEVWPEKVELNDAAFRAVSEIPMKWPAVGQQDGFFFDIEDFIRRVREAK